MYRSRDTTMENDNHNELRRELFEFALKQEEVLKANDHKGSWLDQQPFQLYIKLVKNVGELAYNFDKDWVSSEVKKNCLDVANLAMMIYTTLDNQAADAPADETASESSD